MQVDLTKPVQTKGGRRARVICTDAANSSYPVLVLIADDFGHEDVVRYDSAGYHAGGAGAWDLINVPAEQVRYINVYEGAPSIYSSKEEADHCAGSERVCCLREVRLAGRLIRAEIV